MALKRSSKIFTHFWYAREAEEAASFLIVAGGSSAGILAAVVVENVRGRSAPTEAAKTKPAVAPAEEAIQ